MIGGVFREGKLDERGTGGDALDLNLGEQAGPFARLDLVATECDDDRTDGDLFPRSAGDV